MQLKITSGADAGKTVEVTGNEFTIGREGGVDLVLGDGKASRRHAALKPLPDGRATLYDMGSSNGTYVNGQRVQSVVLSGNEQIQIGDTVMVALVTDPAAVGATSVGQQIPAPQPVGPAPPTQQIPPALQPQPQAQHQPQPPGGFQPPVQTPIQRPSRTQSAIQRIMLQRAVTRATWVGIVAIVLVVGLGIAAALGVFSGGDSKTVEASDVSPQVEPSTVLVVNNKGGGSGGRGTGWVWDASKGLIVTNAHVVAGGQSFSVAQGNKIDIGSDDSGALTAGSAAIPAELKGGGLCEDIAVLQVKNTSG